MRCRIDSVSADTIAVHVMQLPHASGLPLPAYQSAEAAGLDLTAAVADSAPVTLQPGARAIVPTGLAIALPHGTEAQIRPRSGLAARHGVTVLNSPATIDADYRGEIGVLLVNLGSEPFVIRRGERIAQLVLAPVARAQLLPVDSLPSTSRGTGGWGSTGTQ
jgi:dUTP pyrophosphatase